MAGVGSPGAALGSQHRRCAVVQAAYVPVHAALRARRRQPADVVVDDHLHRRSARGGVFAGRIAFRLTGPCPRRRRAPWAAAAFAGIGVLGINGYSEQVLIANSDPIVVTLCLAAIDSHLGGRRRLAFALVVMASLGRPEAWAFAGLYAVGRGARCRRCASWRRSVSSSSRWPGSRSRRSPPTAG